MKRYCCFFIIVMLGFSACSKTDIVEDKNTMRIYPEYPTTKATETSFEAGDVFGVYITKYVGAAASELQLAGNFKNNVPVAFNGESWTTSPVIYWDEGQYDVYGYYPFSSPNSIDQMAFSISTDQSTPGSASELSGYEKSDFLYAVKKAVEYSSEPVKLPFKHKLSRVTVNLLKGEAYEGDIPQQTKVQVHNTVTGSLIDLSTGDVIKDPYGLSATITAKKIKDDQFAAIVVPQTLSNKVPLVEVICGDVSYLLESKFQFKSGMNHVINITMSDNPEKVKIEIGGEIEGWN